MEAATEKTGRGRPTEFHPEYVRQMTAVCNLIGKSTRTVQSHLYALDAMRPLMDGDHIRPEFHWLVNEQEIVRVGILAELGRLRRHGHCGDDELREIAEKLCSTKPAVKDAIAKIRAWRTGKTPPASCLRLTAEIEKAVNGYARTHPDTTQQQIETALVNVLDSIRGDDT